MAEKHSLDKVVLERLDEIFHDRETIYIAVLPAPVNDSKELDNFKLYYVDGGRMLQRDMKHLVYVGFMK